jgi:hypothetical protein
MPPSRNFIAEYSESMRSRSKLTASRSRLVARFRSDDSLYSVVLGASGELSFRRVTDKIGALGSFGIDAGSQHHSVPES